MQILQQSCGSYETNCYILKTPRGDFIIDPGVDSISFIQKHIKNPLAILNTHGHFDHVWDNAKLKRTLNIPIYIHKNDEFMLKDPLKHGFEPSEADFLIENEDELDICGTHFKFHFFPGHTPGSTMIELVGEGVIFSGDFLFYRSIGRWDLPYSNAHLMKQSLEKIMTYKEDFKLLPGHGPQTNLKEEQIYLPSWFRYF